MDREVEAGNGFDTGAAEAYRGDQGRDGLPERFFMLLPWDRLPSASTTCRESSGVF